MITTVTLNPCIDLTIRVPSLKTGTLNIAADTRTDVAGKGINVSVALRALGLPTICTGIICDGGSRQLADFLERGSICGRFAASGGDIRTNVKVYDERTGEMTEINHRGYPVDRTVIHQYLRNLRDCAECSDIVVFAGRIPPGAPDDIYRRSMMALKDLPLKIIVDAEGKPLREAIRRKPYLIKPNIYELESILRRKIASREDAAVACRVIVDRGVEVVCVPMGGDGAVIADKNAAYYAPALRLDIKGIQGAGDSMVAGICKGIMENAGIDGMLRYGVAAASASLLREGTQLCRGKDFNRLLPQVAVEKLDIPAILPPYKKKK